MKITGAVLASAPEHVVDGTAATAAGMTFAQPIVRSLVHKAAADQVLLTDGTRLAPDRFLVAARWPHNHRLYYPAESSAGDPTLLLESVRQAAMYLSHRFYGIPEGHAFLLANMAAAITAPGLPYDAQFPLAATLDVTCHRTRPFPTRFDMRLDAALFIDKHYCGRASLSWSALAPSRYTALRARVRGTSPGGTGVKHRDTTSWPLMAPAAVGRLLTGDVLLSGLPGRTTSTLVMDRTHPVYFDHDSDHIPGMVLFEAMRQAAKASVHPVHPHAWQPLFFDARFGRFAELDAPVMLTTHASAAADAGLSDLHVTARQGEQTVGELHLAGVLSLPAAAEEES